MHQQYTIATIYQTYHKLISPIDIECIISHYIKKDRVFVITHKESILTKQQYNLIAHACDQRQNHYPLAYIIGKKDFFDRTFIVSPDTLIPRPETEILIESVLQYVNNHSHITALCDIGTGSGIIPITLAKETVIPHIYATDISHKALKIAKQNCSLHHVKNITFFQGHLFHDIIQTKLQNTSPHQCIITANLPYVDYNLQHILATKNESKSIFFEPHRALWSHTNGCAHYYTLIKQTLQLHNKTHISFTSFYEIASNQAHDLIHYINNHNDHSCTIKTKIIQDLSKKSRILMWTCS